MKSTTDADEACTALARYRSRLLMIGTALTYLLFTQASYAQLPGDLPWSGSVVNGRTVIVQPGIAAVSCGTTEVVDASQRFTFGLMNIEDIIPGSGKIDKTADVEMYHHPSWLVTEIGNIFGVAINERTGNIFISASSNYGAGFYEQESVLRYGDIGGGAESHLAAGTVYRVDAVTGEATVFAVLPQQFFSFTHADCEGPATKPRRTGVGLGNIHYDQDHDQYFVTNIEDGRIYRLGSGGEILDSYDPGVYDSGVAGIGPSELEDLVYGIAVEPGGRRLFFGGVSTDGQVPLRSIDLSAAGGFVGTVKNDILPDQATWDNYVGVETTHTDVTTEIDGVVHHLSDLEFTPDSRLLVGIRVGCGSSWFTSHNHTGESNVISRGDGGLYDAAITEFDVSHDGNRAEDAYGGVSYYEHADGSVDFVVSSSDIILEEGPHGIAVFPSAEAAMTPITPLAAISYGVVDNGDPKGVGGSVDVFSGACLEARAGRILCEPNGDFTYTFEFLNRTDDPISHAFLIEPSAGVSLTPSYFHFDPPVGAGQLSPPRPVTITGALPGDTVEFLATIHVENFDMCCSKRVVVELPTCECAQVVTRGRACRNFGWPFGSGGSTYTFDVENLQAQTVNHLLLAPSPPASFTIQPNHFPVSMGSFGSSGSLSASFTGPGSTANPTCFLIGLFDAKFAQCCAIEECVSPGWCFIESPDRWEKVGDVTVLFRQDELVLDGLGETGTDGIATDLEGAGAVLHWRDIDDRGVLPTGASLWLQAEIDDGSGPRSFGEVQVVDTGERYTVRADFSAVSAGGVRMTAFLRHRQVAEVVSEGGELGQLDAWPEGGGVGRVPAGAVLILDLDGALVHLPSGESVVADRLLIAPAVAPPAAAPARLRLLAAGIPQIILDDFGPAFDCNANGVEDGAEVVAGEAADADGDGILDSCVTAEDLALNLNTGFDEASRQVLPQGTLPGGTRDPDWQVVSPAVGDSKLVIGPVAAWPPAQPESRWISVDPDRGLSIPGAPQLAFERCFCLAPETTTVALTLSLFADDLASVFLNDQAVATAIGSFAAGSPAIVDYEEVVGAGLLAPGENCLRIVVHDTGGGVTGLDLRGTLNAEKGRCLAQ